MFQRPSGEGAPSITLESSVPHPPLIHERVPKVLPQWHVLQQTTSCHPASPALIQAPTFLVQKRQAASQLVLPLPFAPYKQRDPWERKERAFHHPAGKPQAPWHVPLKLPAPSGDMLCGRLPSAHRRPSLDLWLNAPLQRPSLTPTLKTRHLCSLGQGPQPQHYCHLGPDDFYSGSCHGHCKTLGSVPHPSPTDDSGTPPTPNCDAQQ